MDRGRRSSARIGLAGDLSRVAYDYRLPAPNSYRTQPLSRGSDCQYRIQECNRGARPVVAGYANKKAGLPSRLFLRSDLSRLFFLFGFLFRGGCSRGGVRRLGSIGRGCGRSGSIGRLSGIGGRRGSRGCGRSRRRSGGWRGFFLLAASGKGDDDQSSSKYRTVHRSPWDRCNRDTVTRSPGGTSADSV